MAWYRATSGGKWLVRWEEPAVIQDEDGTTRKLWRDRSRTVPTERDAKRLVGAIESAAALGESWQDARLAPSVTIRTVAMAFVRAVVEAGAPVATQRHRSSMIGAFLDFIGAREESDPGVLRPVSQLSLRLLEEYAATLPSNGRAASTRHRKVLAVEQMWAWAYKRRDTYIGTPEPQTLTGGRNEADRISAPPAVVALDSPRWADVDAMIRELRVVWHVRLAKLLRFTGLRASQGLQLRGSDVLLERGWIRVRAGNVGAKLGRARAIPIHPALRREIESWDPDPGGGFLFARARLPSIPGPAAADRDQPPRADGLVEPFRRAWIAAGVPAERWDGTDPDGEERAKASPTHAIRRCVRTELIRSGVPEAFALYLIGQSQGMTAAAYVPEASPEASPYWTHIVAAIRQIPEIGAAGPASGIPDPHPGSIPETVAPASPQTRRNDNARR